MTKILIITNESDVTSDFVVAELKRRGSDFYRFNTNQIGHGVEIVLDIKNHNFSILDNVISREIDLTNIRAVYYRRPELPILANDLSDAELNFCRSEIYFILEGLYRILDNAFWINSVFNIRNAENKIYQLLLAKQIGFIIPDSIVTNNISAASKFKSKDYEYIIKPVKSGLVHGKDGEEGVIFTSKIILSKQNLERIGDFPVYLQNCIKKAGDVRVTIVGKKVFGAFIHSQETKAAITDWRKSESPLPYSPLEMPSDITQKCLQLTDRMGLHFAAIDFVLDRENNFIFLEINPNGQWAWIERQLKYSISNEIAETLLKKALD